MAVVGVEELLLCTRAGAGSGRPKACPEYANEYVVLVSYLRKLAYNWCTTVKRVQLRRKVVQD